MEIKLSNKDKQKVTPKKEYTPISKKSFKTKKEKAICEAYYAGFTMREIMKEFKISSGTVQSVVNNYGRLNRRKSLKVEERVSHILDNPKVLQELINDYQFMKLKDIYEKYDLYKNGLYYILDKYDVPRKDKEREEILSD